MGSDTIEVRDTRKGGWFIIDNAIIRTYGPDLKATGIAVYAALAMHTDKDQTCYPSHATVAKLLGLSRRQVVREIGKLVKLGLITAETRSGTSYIYTLVKLPETHATQSLVTISHGCHTVTPPMPHSHITHDCESHKQDMYNKTNKQDKALPTSKKSIATLLETRAAKDIITGLGDAYAEAMGWDPKNITLTQRKEWGPILIDLQQKDYTLEDIKGCIGYRLCDTFWQGKDITLRKVASWLPGWIAKGRPKANSPPPERTYQYSKSDLERMELIQRESERQQRELESEQRVTAK